MGNSDAFHFSFSVVVRERFSLPCLSQQSGQAQGPQLPDTSVDRTCGRSKTDILKLCYYPPVSDCKKALVRRNERVATRASWCPALRHLPLGGPPP